MLYISTLRKKKKKKTDNFIPLNPKTIKFFLFFFDKFKKKISHNYTIKVCTLQ